MDIKEQIKKDKWRLALAILLPPLVAIAPFYVRLPVDLLYPYPMNHYRPIVLLVLTLIPYTFFALRTYIRGYKNDDKSYEFFVIGGAKTGFFMGLVIFGSFGLLTALTSTWSFHIILITTLAVAVVGVIAGTMLGYAYAYVFWAYVINKELRYKFEGTLAFMIMAVLPMFLMSISD